METIAVFVDDAEHARRLLAPMLAEGAAPARWIVVSCAPRLTHRIGRWTSHASRENWRERWAAALRQQLQPVFGDTADCQWTLAKGPLDRLARQLRVREGSGLRLLDARRPKVGTPADEIAPGVEGAPVRWATPVAVASSLSAVLALTD